MGYISALNAFLKLKKLLQIKDYIFKKLNIIIF